MNRNKPIIKYPSLVCAGGPTPLSELYICDVCGRAEWFQGYGGNSGLNIHRCQHDINIDMPVREAQVLYGNKASRMRRATPEEYAAGIAAIKHQFGKGPKTSANSIIREE